MSPMTRYNLIFWAVTTLFLPYVLIMIVLALIVAYLPFTDHDRVLNWFERQIAKPIKWRNSLSIVKRSYDRAHLFDYIKSFK